MIKEGGQRVKRSDDWLVRVISISNRVSNSSSSRCIGLSHRPSTTSIAVTCAEVGCAEVACAEVG